MVNRDNIHIQAITCWEEQNRKGTIEAVTGIGKTFISLRAISTLPVNSNIVYLAETSQRAKDVYDDIAKFDKIFKTNLLSDYNFEFACYQSAYKWTNKHFHLVIADEIHDSLTPEYYKFYLNNSFDCIIGLSATIDRRTKYDDITKGEMLDRIAPVCFRYTLDNSIKDNLSRKLRVYVINHDLNDTDKTMKAGTKNKPFMTTEFRNYKYWESRYEDAIKKEISSCDTIEEFNHAKRSKELNILKMSNARAKVLYNLPSKLISTNKLIEVLNGKSIIFSNSIDFLLKITPNVVSSKNSEKKNTDLRIKFDNGLINIIGSFKMLKQGANLKGATNVIISSYYSKEKDIIQRVGRLRKEGNAVGNVFIFRTKNTREDIWFHKMMRNISEFDVIECDNIEDCIFKYLTNESNN